MKNILLSLLVIFSLQACGDYEVVESNREFCKLARDTKFESKSITKLVKYCKDNHLDKNSSKRKITFRTRNFDHYATIDYKPISNECVLKFAYWKVKEDSDIFVKFGRPIIYEYKNGLYFFTTKYVVHILRYSSSKTLSSIIISDKEEFIRDNIEPLYPIL